MLILNSQFYQKQLDKLKMLITHNKTMKIKVKLIVCLKISTLNLIALNQN